MLMKGNISRESQNGVDAGSLDPVTKATLGDSMREAIVLRGSGPLKDFLWGPGTTVIELFPQVTINTSKEALLNCHAPGCSRPQSAQREDACCIGSRSTLQ